MSNTASDHLTKLLKLENELEHELKPISVPSDNPNTSANDADLAGGSIAKAEDAEEALDNNPEDNCCICLQVVVDRTILPKCSHEFCFECVLVWTEQSRRCPLCSQNVGEYLIHSIRSRYDYRKHFLPPLKSTSPRPATLQTAAELNIQRTRQQARRRRQDRQWGIRQREHDEVDKLERSIVRRRWIYEHDLYAKHVASNSFTKYRPYPTPAQFSASQDLISRTTTFIRRELQIWEGLDVEFLTTLIISLMKSIDIRSESAVKLIAEFLDLDAPYTPGGRHVNAEHFAHEVYSYVRSPYKDLFVYDSIVQYDNPTNLQPPPDPKRSRRWYSSSSQLEADSLLSAGEQPNIAHSSSIENYQEQHQAGPSRQDSRSSDIQNQSLEVPIQSDQEMDDHQHHRPGSGTYPTLFGTPSRSKENAHPYSDETQGSKGKGRAHTREATQPSADLSSLEFNNAGQGSQTGKSNLEASLRGSFKGTAGFLDSGLSQTFNTRVKRPPRVRTLQDSVKAHLASARPASSAAQSGGHDTILCPDENQSPKSDSPSNSSPALLTRLSDSFHTPNF